MEYLNDTNDMYKNIEEFNPEKKQKLLIVFENILLMFLVIKNLIQQ